MRMNFAMGRLAIWTSAVVSLAWAAPHNLRAAPPKDKSRPPTSASKLSPLVVRDLHLREKKTGAAEFVFFVALGRAAAIEPPIPEREDDDVG